MPSWPSHEHHQPYPTSKGHYAYNPSTSIPKTKITIAGAEATLLASVWCRAQDAASPAPILGDPYAQAILDHCDIDYTHGPLSHLHDERWARFGAGRAKVLDDWCQAFLDEAGDEPVQVLQIACGLDSRVLRIRRGPNVRWIDLDRPVVVNLRERIYGAARWDPQQQQQQQQQQRDNTTTATNTTTSGSGAAAAVAGGGEYLLRNLSVTSDRWLRDIPQDRRTLVIVESLLYHFSPEQVGKLIHDVVEHFGGAEPHAEEAREQRGNHDNVDVDVDDDENYDYDGYDDEKAECRRPRKTRSHGGGGGGGVRQRCEIVFDVVGTIIKRRTSQVEWLRPMGIKIMSGFDSPEEILPYHPRLRLLETVSWDQMMRTERKAACAPPWFGPKGTMLAYLLPSFRHFTQVMRFQF